MYLTKEQLSLLFRHFLKEYLLPRSFKHLPSYEDLNNGGMLTKRLFLVLRAKEFSHLVFGDRVAIQGLYNVAKRYLEKHQKVFIVGLNYWFTIHDLEELRKLYEREFSE